MYIWDLEEVWIFEKFKELYIGFGKYNFRFNLGEKKRKNRKKFFLFI